MAPFVLRILCTSSVLMTHTRDVGLSNDVLRFDPYAKAFKAQEKLPGKKEKSAGEAFRNTLAQV